MTAILNWTEAGTSKDKTFTATVDVNGTAMEFKIVKTGGGRFRLLVNDEKAGADSPKLTVKKDDAEEIVKERLAAMTPAPVPETAPEGTAEAASEIAPEIEPAPAPVETPVAPEPTPDATLAAQEATPEPAPAPAPAPVTKAAPNMKDGWTRKKIKQPTVSPCGRASVIELDDAGKQWKATVNGTTDEQVFKTMSAAKAFCDAELKKLPALNRG